MLPLSFSNGSLFFSLQGKFLGLPSSSFLFCLQGKSLGFCLSGSLLFFNLSKAFCFFLSIWRSSRSRSRSVRFSSSSSSRRRTAALPPSEAALLELPTGRGICDAFRPLETNLSSTMLWVLPVLSRLYLSTNPPVLTAPDGLGQTPFYLALQLSGWNLFSSAVFAFPGINDTF